MSDKKIGPSLLNRSYNGQVQDSHNLALSGEIMELLVKRYQGAVKRGDSEEIFSVTASLRAQVDFCTAWTNSIVKGNVGPQVDSVAWEQQAEHSNNA